MRHLCFVFVYVLLLVNVAFKSCGSCAVIIIITFFSLRPLRCVVTSCNFQSLKLPLLFPSEFCFSTTTLRIFASLASADLLRIFLCYLCPGKSILFTESHFSSLIFHPFHHFHFTLVRFLCVASLCNLLFNPAVILINLVCCVGIFLVNQLSFFPCVRLFLDQFWAYTIFNKDERSLTHFWPLSALTLSVRLWQLEQFMKIHVASLVKIFCRVCQISFHEYLHWKGDAQMRIRFFFFPLFTQFVGIAQIWFLSICFHSYWWLTTLISDAKQSFVDLHPCSSILPLIYFSTAHNPFIRSLPIMDEQGLPNIHVWICFITWPAQINLTCELVYQQSFLVFAATIIFLSFGSNRKTAYLFSRPHICFVI